MGVFRNCLNLKRPAVLGALKLEAAVKLAPSEGGRGKQGENRPGG